MNPILRVAKWALGEAREKLDVRAKWQEIKGEGKKYGRRFVIFAVIWECIEDIVFPLLAIYFKMPALVPFFLIMHFEPIVWPTGLWAFRMWDRSKGRIPWEPDRTAQSSNLRSAGKSAVYKVAAIGWYGMILMCLGHSPKILGVFAALMLAFGFIHERIWHDSNYGIGNNGVGDVDHVFMKRVIAKTTTYCIVSTTILASLFRVSFDGVPWLTLLACQGLGMALYFVFEAVWARSKWGVTQIVRDGGVGVYRKKLGTGSTSPLVGEIHAESVTVISGGNQGPFIL